MPIEVEIDHPFYGSKTRRQDGNGFVFAALIPAIIAAASAAAKAAAVGAATTAGGYAVKKIVDATTTQST